MARFVDPAFTWDGVECDVVVVVICEVKVNRSSNSKS